jgi:broad-specificity NMP kinase
MKRKIRNIINETKKNDIIIDGHYAASVVPKELASIVFVLRRDPVELEEMMKKCGYSERKLAENLASEILDVCLMEALNVHGPVRICELNVTGKSSGKIVGEILTILQDSSKCCVGTVDWLGKLEAQGLTDKYLKI